MEASQRTANELCQSIANEMRCGRIGKAGNALHDLCHICCIEEDGKKMQATVVVFTSILIGTLRPITAICLLS